MMSARFERGEFCTLLKWADGQLLPCGRQVSYIQKDHQGILDCFFNCINTVMLLANRGLE